MSLVPEMGLIDNKDKGELPPPFVQAAKMKINKKPRGVQIRSFHYTAIKSIALAR
jgi:hypothetical protein